MSVYVCICQISNVSAAVSQMELCTIPSRVKTHFPLHTCLLPKFQNSKCWVLHSDRCGTPCKYSAWNLPAIIKMSPLHHSCSWIFGFDAMVGITRSKVISIIVGIYNIYDLYLYGHPLVNTPLSNFFFQDIHSG